MKKKFLALSLVFVMVMGLVGEVVFAYAEEAEVDYAETVAVEEVEALSTGASITNLSVAPPVGRTVTFRGRIELTGFSDPNDPNAWIHPEFEVFIVGAPHTAGIWQGPASTHRIRTTPPNNPLRNFSNQVFHNRQYGVQRARARVVNDHGQRLGWSEWTQFTVTPSTPDTLVPDNLQPTSARLHWNWSSADVQNFDIHIYNSARTLVHHTTVLGSARNYTYRNLWPDTRYYFSVRATSHGAIGNWSVLRSFTTPPQQDPPITITWNGNGGLPSPMVSNHTPGQPIGTLPLNPPTRAGHEFVGWFTHATGGTQITAGSITPSSNTTFWARWREFDIRPYNVSIDNITTTSARFIGNFPTNVPYPHGVDRVEFAISNHSTGVRTPETGYRRIEGGEGSWVNGSDGTFGHVLRGLSADTRYHVSVRTVTRGGHFAHASPVEFTTTRQQTGGNLDIRFFPRGSTEQLSANFHANEFRCNLHNQTTARRGRTCPPNNCSFDTFPISMLLVDVLQEIRDTLSERHGRNVPITITSGFRCPGEFAGRHNWAVGSSNGSFHTRGTAADISAAGVGLNELHEVARTIMVRRGINIGLADPHASDNWLYIGDDFVHVGVGLGPPIHPRYVSSVTGLAGEVATLNFEGIEVAPEEQTFTIRFEPAYVSEVDVRVSNVLIRDMDSRSPGLVTVTFLPLSNNFSVEVSLRINSDVPANTYIPPIRLFDTADESQVAEATIFVEDEVSPIEPTPTPPPTGQLLTFTVPAIQAAPGTDVSVPINITNNNNAIEVTTVTVTFDSSRLEWQDLGTYTPGNSATHPWTLGGFMPLVAAPGTIGTNSVTFNFMDMNGVGAANGTLATLRLRVRPDAPAGDANVTLSFAAVGDSRGALSAEQFNNAPGRVTVQDSRIGDVNGDGTVNVFDSLHLARVIAGWHGYYATHAAADVNGDGQVNVFDTLHLARHIAGWAGYEILGA